MLGITVLPIAKELLVDILRARYPVTDPISVVISF
jgi:hypothetical protein